MLIDYGWAANLILEMRGKAQRIARSVL